MNKNLKYFIPILGIHYSLKDMQSIFIKSSILYIGTAIYHAITIALMLFSLAQ